MYNQHTLIDQIREDSGNGSLYQELGDLLLDQNPRQAYLCYQNAAFYAANDEAAMNAISAIDDLEEKGVTVPPSSIVILSYKSLELIQTCLNSIRQFNASACYEIVVVDNASKDESTEWLRTQEDIVLVENDTNRGFPGGCNDGIQAANPANDIFLLNSDTIMMPNALFCLRMALYENDTVGATGSMSNYVFNGQRIDENLGSIEEYLEYSYKNNVPDASRYEKKIFLTGFAVLIKRSVLNEIGLLDERFTPGNYEDNDLGLRIGQAGYQNLLCHDSFIVHLGSVGFKKDPEKYATLLLENRRKIDLKYGFDAEEVSVPRNVDSSLIPFDNVEEFDAFEVGSELGATIGRLEYLYPFARFSGAESRMEYASFSGKNPEISRYDKNPFDECLSEKVDLIILHDYLARVPDPIEMLKSARDHLSDNGCIIFELPNITNFAVLANALTGRLSWRSNKATQYAYLHVFSYSIIKEMIEIAGMQLDFIRGEVTANEIPPEQNWISELIESENTMDKIQFITDRYVVRVRKKA